MGCDGGTIPTRDELVRLKKKPEQKDKDGHRLFKWQHCALSQQPLRKPVVACELGKLYNKESVIELLLDKERKDVTTTHLEKLKDVTELVLTSNPSYDATKHAVGDGMYNDALVSPWICPITGLEMNGRFKFVFSFNSGKVVAERALKVLRSDPAEKEKYLEEDIVVINPEDDEFDLMYSKMNARRARIKAAKKAAKESKKKAAADAEIAAEKEGFKIPGSVAGASGSSTKSNDSKDEPPTKKVKTSSSSFGDQQQAVGGKKTDDPSKVKGSSKFKSVQNDPNASEVYKRLFSSHKSAQKQPKGHWVTFDPRYN